MIVASSTITSIRLFGMGTSSLVEDTPYGERDESDRPIPDAVDFRETSNQ